MITLIYFRRQIFIFLFSFPGFWFFVVVVVVCYYWILWHFYRTQFFLTNKMKYVITEITLGLCITKLCKSKFFLTFLPIYLTFLTHIINSFYSLTQFLNLFVSPNLVCVLFGTRKKFKICHNDILKYLGNSLKYHWDP